MKKTYIKKILASSFISLFFIQALFFLIEPTMADAVVSTAPSAATVGLTVDPGITITTPTAVTMPAMTVAINGSTASAAWTVKTNNTIGYDLKIHASTTPALKSGTDNFADYTTTPAVWSITNGTKQFGFSAYGADTSTVTWGTGAGCGSATTPLGTMLYSGFATTDKTIATPAVPTPYAGVATTVCFAAEQKGIYAASGAYTATVTATATTK